MKRCVSHHVKVAPRKARLLHAVNALIFFHQISICHSSNVIAYRAMQSFPFDAFRRAFAEAVGINKVRFENASQHSARTPVHLGHRRVIINMLIQEFPEGAIRFDQSVAVANQRNGLSAHLVWTLHAGISDRLCACRNHVVHFVIDDVSND